MIINKERLPLSKIISVGILPNFLKIFLYRIMGYKIGRNVKIGFCSIISAKSVVIGDNVKIGFATIIRCRELRINNYSQIASLVYLDVPIIKIGKDVLIRENVLIGGNETKNSRFEIGDRSHIRQGCNINTSMPVKIGNETAIGGGTFIFTHSSWQSMLEGYPCTYEEVIIGDNVWISWDTFILPGVKIDNGVLVTAGSVVTKSLPEKCIASGNPAKIVIPAGLYPRKTNSAEKDEFIRMLINEFMDYLKFHGIGNKCEQKNNYLIYTIYHYKKNYSIIYASSLSAVFDDIIDLTNSVLVVNSPVLDKDINEIKKQNMFLDIDKMNRTGSNAIGEELVDFLLKYGIKFKRNDN